MYVSGSGDHILSFPQVDTIISILFLQVKVSIDPTTGAGEPILTTISVDVKDEEHRTINIVKIINKYYFINSPIGGTVKSAGSLGPPQVEAMMDTL